MSQDVAVPGLLAEAAPGCAATMVPASLQPRVLLVTESGEPSGVGEHMITLAAAIRSGAYPTLAFAASAGGSTLAARARRAGLASLTVSAAALRDGGAEFEALVEHQGPDIVHVHAGIGWEGHALAAACNRGGCAVVRTEHLPYTLRKLGDRELEAAYARGVRHVDQIICVCEAARRTFRMSGVDRKRFSVVYNGIELRAPGAERDAVRRALGTGDARLILTVARFTDQKRHRTLLNALPALLAARHNACLVWIGTGPLEAELRAQADALGVAARVLFLGQRGDVPELMAAADLLCLPSYFEGHPLVILEAMAAGLPVVAARSLGITEAVRNEETGLLFPLDNAAVLAYTLARLLADRGLAARLAAAARLVVRRQFSARRMGEETLAVYRAVLARRAARH